VLAFVNIPSHPLLAWKFAFKISNLNLAGHEDGALPQLRIFTDIRLGSREGQRKLHGHRTRT